MNNLVRGSFLLLISLTTLGTACKKSAVTPTTNNDSVNTAAVLTSGSWTITSYTEKSENKTTNYADIVFNFKNDGTLLASGTKSSTGTWTISPPSNGYYGSVHETITINLGNSSPFNRLDRIWNVVEKSATTIRLDNREASQDEHITFSKNR